MGTPIWSIEGVAVDSTGEMVDDSLGAMVKHIENHFTNPEKVYPTLANGADLVSGADWVLGAFTTVVAGTTITEDFHIIDVAIEACDKNAVMEVVLYAGDPDVEIARFRFAVVGGFWGNSRYSVDTSLIAANSRIRAKVASSDGTANEATVRISIGYILHA